MTNLRDKKDYISTIWDWTPYNICFEPTKIRMTDIDGFVERQGKFLVIETKRPNAIIPEGQRIMFRRMAMTGLFTILVVWGQTDMPERFIKITQRGTTDPKKCNQTILKGAIKQWFESADHRSSHNMIAKEEVIKLALDIQRGYLTGNADLSFLSGALVQKIYDLFQE